MIPIPRFSIIHPTRGRPLKSAQTIYNWIDKSKLDPYKDIEVIVSMDKSDPELENYRRMYRDGLKCFNSWLINDNKSLVDATNIAAKESKGDILIYVSDDFECPDNWAHFVGMEFENCSGPRLLKVDDCLQKFEVPVLTIPIMNRALLNLLGYFFHPDFKSMHCDEHLYQRCARLGVIKKAPYLKFEHHHVSNGKAENDETYRRSAANWDHGVMMMRKHRRLGFSQ